MDNHIMKSNAFEYAEFLRKIERIDSKLKRFVIGKFGRYGGNFYGQFMERLRQNDPNKYRKIHDFAKIGSTLSLTGKDVSLIKSFMWEFGKDIENKYLCEQGFIDKEIPKTYAVYVWGEKAVGDVSKPHKTLQNQLAEDYGGKRKWTFGFDNRICVCNLTPSEAKRLAKNKYVEKVIEEPSVSILYGEYAPYPVYVPGGENVDWGVTTINVAPAWSKNIKGQGVKICIIDTGIDYDHVDLIDRYKGGYNFLVGSIYPKDDHGHGTACAGIACASDTGVGYIGVAPEADLYACKVLDAKGSGSLTDVAAGVDWCRVNGIDVISMSLGIVDYACSGTLATACSNAWGAGLVIVAAAGNDGGNCPDNNCINMPGNCSSCIAVGSIDLYGAVSGFSSRGPEIEIVTPGEGITSAKAAGLDMYGNGLHIVGGNWIWWNGTSAATPHAAGAAALIKCWYPEATNLQIRTWLAENASDI